MEELADYKYVDEQYAGSRSVHNPGKEGYRYDILHPITGKPCKQLLMGYRFPESRMKELLQSGKVLFGDDESKIIELNKVYAKDYQSKLSSLIEIDGRVGANELRDIFAEIPKAFKHPKPSSFIELLLSFTTSRTSLILDFFAGSRTTLHAAMALNAADGGQRQCILVTNNENQIAEEVCYERNRRVIEGYTKPNGEAVAGLSWNALRYYRTDFVKREASPENREELTRRALAMLCIKENCYDDITPNGTDPAEMRLFAESDGTARMLVLLPSRYVDESVERAVELVESLPHSSTEANAVLKVYVFSPSSEPFTEEFAGVADRVELCALPEAIYKAYREILPAEESDEENE